MSSVTFSMEGQTIYKIKYISCANSQRGQYSHFRKICPRSCHVFQNPLFKTKESQKGFWFFRSPAAHLLPKLKGATSNGDGIQPQPCPR